MTTRCKKPHNRRATANGINTAAVATRFQFIRVGSSENWQASSHHIRQEKSRRRQVRSGTTGVAPLRNYFRVADDSNTIREWVLRPVSLPVEVQSFRVFRNIICQCHRQEMVPHALYSRSTFASLLTESLRLRGQLMRMAP